jgi:hypothetical protein
MNEGSFQPENPKIFIPYDVKRELGLPTFKERAIYTIILPFLQRAKIYLLYNTESDGLDGEKSRFITQLEVAAQTHLSHEIYNAVYPVAYKPVIIEKSDR